MATKAPQLIQQYVTGGDRSLREWHLLLRRVTFGAAITLMLASVVSLHWACVLIGLPDHWYAPVAWIVPLAMELGMAAVASTATTIRKDPKPGREDHPGGYYVSLWVIFSFIMLLAQAANIGHAFSVIETRLAGSNIPEFIPDGAIYSFAALFAALFPLGGTLLVHVSGFLRAHGTGARWIEDDAEVVYVQAQPGQPAAQQPRVQRTPRAPMRAQGESAKVPTPETVRGETRTAAAAHAQQAPRGGDSYWNNPTREEAYRAYRTAREAGKELDGRELGELLGVHEGNARTQRNKKFRPRYEAELHAADPEPTDPIVAQVEADEKAASDTKDASAA